MSPLSLLLVMIVMNKFFIQDNMWGSYTSYILLSTASLGPHHGSHHHHRHPDQALDCCSPMRRRESPWRKVLSMFLTMVATWQQEDPHLDTYKQLGHPDPTSGQFPQSGWIVETPCVAAVFWGRERRSQTSTSSKPNLASSPLSFPSHLLPPRLPDS